MSIFGFLPVFTWPFLAFRTALGHLMEFFGSLPVLPFGLLSWGFSNELTNQ